jgi:N-formylmaleamate deformylase
MPESPTERVLTQPALADLARVNATSRWIRSGSIALHVLDYGREGVPVLMLPGITSPAVTMDFVARELQDMCRPLVLDIRGRGLSDSADSAEGYTLDDYAEDCESIITQLNLEQPLLMGHSMGACIAAKVATRGHVRQRGSVLCDPPMSGPGRPSYPTKLSAFLDQLAQARRGTTADEVAKSWPRWPRAELELRARWLASCSADAITATHCGFETEDFFPLWSELGSGATLIYGGDSPVVTEDGAREAAQRNPSGALVEVPGAGHMLFWDEPQPALEALRTAIASYL